MLDAIDVFRSSIVSSKINKFYEDGNRAVKAFPVPDFGNLV
jgi:hypothetical protein